MTIRILALSGSLRPQSTNTALLRFMKESAPGEAVVDLHDYSDVPLYRGDREVPASVHRLNEALAEADGVLIATPEYNYSIPGVLKNAIDWASRPAYQSVFSGKPVAVVSAAASFVGGARAQQHLKPVLLSMGALVYPAPEFLVGAAHTKVSEGTLHDRATQELAAKFIDGFAVWTATLVG